MFWGEYLIEEKKVFLRRAIVFKLNGKNEELILGAKM